MALRFLVILFSIVFAASPGAACTVQELASRVVVLDTSGTKAVNDFTDESGYHRPQASKESPAKYVPDLKAAFRLAGGEKGGFRDALCELDAIFVDPSEDPDAPVGWGFWEGPDQGDGTFQAIGVSTRLWTDPDLDTTTGVETFLAQGLLMNRLPGFGYSGASDNSRAMSLLGVLAHEMGHISFRDGDQIDPSCFTKNGWKNGGALKPRAFKRYRDVVDNNDLTRFDLIKSLVDAGMYDDANKRLNRVYSSGKFAGLFALMSPEEDFAETIKLAVMNKAGLRRLDASIEGYEDTNVMAPLNQKEGGLYNKAVCFWPFLVPTRKP